MLEQLYTIECIRKLPSFAAIAEIPLLSDNFSLKFNIIQKKVIS